MNSSPTSRSVISSKMKWRLGLLLVVAAVALSPTLFLAVSAISKPTTMQLTQSLEAPVASASAPAEALTILVGSGNQLYYYFGTATPTAADSLYATTPARPIGQVIKAWRQRHKATVFTKSDAQANYKAMVDLLDEMNTSGQRSYAVVVTTAADRQLLQASAQQ